MQQQTTTGRINWRSNDLWLTLTILIGSLFGLSEDAGTQIAGAITGVVGVLGIIRDFFKDAKFVGFRKWILDPNTWAYILSAVTLVVPFASGLVPPLKELTEAILSGNYAKAITAAFSFVAIAVGIFRKRT